MYPGGCQLDPYEDKDRRTVSAIDKALKAGTCRIIIAEKNK